MMDCNLYIFTQVLYFRKLSLGISALPEYFQVMLLYIFTPLLLNLSALVTIYFEDDAFYI